jgi:S1-C subfamily serine protease
MNSKQLFTTVGLGALTVTLMTLPGSSAGQPDRKEATGQSFPAQEASRQMGELRQALNNLEVAQMNSADGDDSFQVFLSSGGSWLGAGISEVTADKMKELKLPAERGVVLGKIVPDSPAAKAGLKESDVVTDINGQRVEGTEQFRRIIREIPSGRVTQFTVWRDGRTQTINVTLGKSEMRHDRTLIAPAAPGNFAFQIPEVVPDMEMFGSGPWVSSRTRLGVDAEDLDGEFGNYFGAPEGEGILVRGVFPDTPAAKAGLKVGDVITSVNGERIRSVGELREKIAEKREDKTITLGLVRNKTALSVTVQLPAPAVKKDFHSGVRTNI